jgi:hypothetical protein
MKEVMFSGYVVPFVASKCSSHDKPNAGMYGAESYFRGGGLGSSHMQHDGTHAGSRANDENGRRGITEGCSVAPKSHSRCVTKISSFTIRTRFRIQSNGASAKDATRDKRYEAHRAQSHGETTMHIPFRRHRILESRDRRRHDRTWFVWYVHIGTENTMT